MTSPRFRLLFTLGLLVLAGACGACAPVEETVPPDRTPAPADEAAHATAEDVYRGYIDAFNAVDLTDPQTFEPISKFTTETFYSAEVLRFAPMLEAGVTVLGNAEVQSSYVNWVFQDSTVAATACIDGSDLRLVDRQGEPVAREGTPGVFEVYLEFVSYGGELRLHQQASAPHRGCRSGRELPLPGGPLLEETGTPSPEAPESEQSDRCKTYPSGIKIC